MPLLLKASSIRKSYESLPVLNDVSMEVQTGQMVAIVGPSGAGKSTLLQILGTLDTADRGQIQFEQTDISKLRGNELARFRSQNIGFVFQFHNLLPEFSALENVCMPGFLRPGMNEKAVRKRATELLDQMGLSDRLDHKPAQLSGGEQQRAAVARALTNSPKIVFADEPTGNLDSENAAHLHQIFVDLCRLESISFVIVTHNLELAGLADHQIRLEKGYIV